MSCVRGNPIAMDTTGDAIPAQAQDLDSKVQSKSRWNK